MLSDKQKTAVQQYMKKKDHLHEIKAWNSEYWREAKEIGSLPQILVGESPRRLMQYAAKVMWDEHEKDPFRISGKEPPSSRRRIESNSSNNNSNNNNNNNSRKKNDSGRNSQGSKKAKSKKSDESKKKKRGKSDAKMEEGKTRRRRRNPPFTQEEHGIMLKYAKMHAGKKGGDPSLLNFWKKAQEDDKSLLRGRTPVAIQMSYRNLISDNGLKHLKVLGKHLDKDKEEDDGDGDGDDDDDDDDDDDEEQMEEEMKSNEEVAAKIVSLIRRETELERSKKKWVLLLEQQRGTKEELMKVIGGKALDIIEKKRNDLREVEEKFLNLMKDYETNMVLYHSGDDDARNWFKETNEVRKRMNTVQHELESAVASVTAKEVGEHQNVLQEGIDKIEESLNKIESQIGQILEERDELKEMVGENNVEFAIILIDSLSKDEI